MYFAFLARSAAALLVGVCAQATTAGTTVIEQPGRGTNRIEVTGNEADGDRRTRCAEPRSQAGNANSSNINSVNISGQSLHGKTIIVTDGGRHDCAAKPGSQGSNVNSVNIR